MDIGEEKVNSNSSSEANSLVINDSGQVNQNTQTWLSFPSQTPPDVEAMLLKYGLIEQLPTEGIKILVCKNFTTFIFTSFFFMIYLHYYFRPA